MVTKGSVLVVDDEVNLCRILGAKLTRSGYDVVAVHDGRQAVEKVRDSEFDVVLLDLILPKMDGLSALAEIRRMRSALPVIVMTACENAEVLEQARSHGVSAYVNKPFDLDNLVSLVRDASRAGSSGYGRNLPGTTVLFARHQPVSLEIQNGGSGKVYWTEVLDKDDQTLSVLAPQIDGKTVELAPRTSVKAGLAVGDAYYSFASRVVCSKEGTERVLVLEKPGVIYRIQRRNNLRVPMHVPLNYCVYSEETDSECEGALGSGETRDVSLSGACIVVPEEILPGEMLKVELRPKTGKDKIEAIAHVMRSKSADVPGTDGYILGCRFTRVDDTIKKLLDR